MRLIATLPIRRIWAPAVGGACALILLASGQVLAQRADDTRVLLYDEAHNNFSSAGPIAGLLDIGRGLGLEVRINRNRLDSALRDGINLLVICVPSNITDSAFVARFREPRGARGLDWPYWSPDLERSPYTNDELRALIAWIEAGGSLLLILDHAPGPVQADALARALGVDVRNAFTSDRSRYPPGYGAPPPADVPVRAVPTNRHWILFSRSAQTLGSHPITDGPSADRRVDAVATYTGSSIQGPVGSTALLVLSDSAVDYSRPWPDGPENLTAARGRSQAIAFGLGAGRVVVIAEAGALMKDPFGSRPPGTGLDYSHANNRTFAGNVLGWLTAGGSRSRR
jgi:hypothetical protein